MCSVEQEKPPICFIKLLIYGFIQREISHWFSEYIASIVML